jgi:hypothetical protein
MGEILMDFLKNKQPHGFEPRPIYSADGDFISFYLRDEDCYAERVDERLTIYHSVENDALVGCKIKGIRRLLKTLGDFGVSIQDEEISVNWLFLAGAALASSRQHVDRYQQLGRQAGNFRIPKKTLEPIPA